MSEGASKPVPALRGEEAAYYAAAAEGRLAIQRCPACARAIFYPRTVCPHCRDDTPEWVAAGGHGTIYSFSVLHRPGGPGFEVDVPYVVALIDLEEGVRVMANVVNVAAESVEIGMRVRVAFEGRGEGFVVPQFEPAEVRP